MLILPGFTYAALVSFLSGSKQQGNKVTFEAATIENAKARQHYRLKFDVQAGGTELDVSFTDETERVPTVSYTHLRADSIIELYAINEISLHLAFIIHPRNTESKNTIGFNPVSYTHLPLRTHYISHPTFPYR